MPLNSEIPHTHQPKVPLWYYFMTSLFGQPTKLKISLVFFGAIIFLLLIGACYQKMQVFGQMFAESS